MDEQKTSTSEEGEPDGGSARAGVSFAVKPKVVFTESGPTINFELACRGRGTVDVGFRLSWKGELLGFEGPAINLKAGAAPYTVSLRLPLDSGVGRGAKVKVSVVGPDGTSLAVSSTGVVSLTLPNHTTFALGTKGVVVSAAFLGGSVIGVATWPWGDGEPIDPVVEATEETTSADEPNETAPAVITEPPAALWPLVVPSEIVASVAAEPSEELPDLEFFAFGRPEQLTVSVDGRPGTSETSNVFDVAVTYQGRSHRVGSIELPTLVDPASLVDLPSPIDLASDEELTLLASVLAQAIPLMGEGTGASRVCFDEDTFDWLGGYRTSSGVGDVTVSFIPVVGDGRVLVAVAVAYESATELELLRGVTELTATVNGCPPKVMADLFAWVSTPSAEGDDGGSPPDEPSDGPAEETTEDSAEDSAEVGTVEEIGESDDVEFVAEPVTEALSLGHVGERVAALQGALAKASLFDGEVDGRFGRDTDAAVRRLQINEGLDVDGLAGPATHAVLGLSYPGEARADVVYGPEPSTGALSLGHEGDRVAALQEAMSKQGFFTGDIDGSFGRVTEQAVKDAQGEFGLENDGIAGPATHEALALGYP